MSLETPAPGPRSASERAAGPPPRRHTLWRHRDFVKLWSAQTISQFGDEITGLIGLQATIWVGAVGSFAGFLPVFFSQVRTLTRIPEPS
ncbi:MAG: hypothetical protein ACR2I5_07310 [Candidatus Limnocylindria bacterium]